MISSLVSRFFFYYYYHHHHIYIYIYIYIYIPKETVTAIMTLYKNTNVCSPIGNINFFNIVAGVLQGDILAQYMLIISQRLCTSNINRSNKRKWFHTKKR